MSLFKRYQIKYQSESDKKTIVNSIKTQIEKIYSSIKNKFHDDETQHVVITGSAALFLYINALGYDDLLVQLAEPSDVDILIVLNNKKMKTKPHFTIYYIDDFRRIKKVKTNGTTQNVLVEPANATLESSVSFKDFWTSDNINEFDLTYVFGSGVHYKVVNGINLIKLDELLEFYEADKDNTERGGKDHIKIQIIKEILTRLKANPRPDIISDSPGYQEMNVNKIKELGKLNSITSFSKRKLFESPTKLAETSTPVSKFKPSKLFDESDNLQPTRLFDEVSTPQKSNKLVDEFAPLSDTESNSNTNLNSNPFIPKIIDKK